MVRSHWFKFLADEKEVKELVFEECEKYLRQIPKEMQDKLEPKLPNQVRHDTPEIVVDYDYDKITNTLVAVPNKNNASNK